MDSQAKQEIWNDTPNKWFNVAKTVASLCLKIKITDSDKILYKYEVIKVYRISTRDENN